MRVLLLGADGQVGFELQRTLAPLGQVVPTTLNGRLADGRACGRSDFSDPGALASLLESTRPDWVANAAAYTAVDRAEDDANLAERINHWALTVLGAWAARSGALVVHYSTDYVFDGRATQPYREDDATAPLGVYGRSKLAGERALRDSGCDHLILRTAWVYAARGHNFLRTMLRLAGEREQLRIVADQIGAPTSANAISQAVVAMLPRSDETISTKFEQRGGVVNLVCAGETSWHGFATAIVSGLKSRGAKFAVKEIVAIGSGEFPVKARRPSNSRLDLTRLRERFDIAMPTWERALGRELDALKGTI